MDTFHEPSQTETILESISDGVFTVDRKWRITSFNRAAEEITGVSRQVAQGRMCSEIFRSSVCEGACALRETMETGKPVINRSCFIVTRSEERIPISVSTALLRNKQGTVIGGVETFRDLSEVENLRRELKGQYTLGDLVTRSPAMSGVFSLIQAVASTSTTALIQGETGTGKELAARAIHSSGSRSEEPFVVVNCGALPEPLLESELFGYKRGAFTGADRDKPGRFSLAGKGTIFLDEVGEIGLPVQVKLLRVLQERRFEPLGGIKSERTDARVIAATNRDLSAMAAEGRFREDLFYRINVVPITIPPLRQRKEDIPLLVEHFVNRFNSIQDRHVKGMTQEAVSVLLAHDWPGNVRELENLVERAFVLSSGEWLDILHLPSELTGTAARGYSLSNMDSARRSAEGAVISAALRINGYNRTAAARYLGIHKSTLYRKMAALGLHLYQDSDT